MRAGELDVEDGIRGIEGERLRLALIFIIREVVEPVLEDRSSVRRAELLIRIRKDVPRDEVGCVEAVVAEVAGKRSCWSVGARFGDGVHLNAGRTPLRGVEPAREELKFGNRIATESRLTAVASLGDRNFLTVHIELKFAVPQPLTGRRPLVRGGEIGRAHV